MKGVCGHYSSMGGSNSNQLTGLSLLPGSTWYMQIQHTTCTNVVEPDLHMLHYDHDDVKTFHE